MSRQDVDLVRALVAGADVVRDDARWAALAAHGGDAFEAAGLSRDEGREGLPKPAS